MDNTTRRTSLIEKIQGLRTSSVIVYFTGDRLPFPAQIAEDAVLPIYRHLLALRASKRATKGIDLFLYTRGGDVSVPWRIISMLREYCDKLSVLIPYKAHSAGTMIAMGADEICMGPKAELGPIDPTLSRRTSGAGTVAPTEISVEDVSSYISFMQERARITDQSALAQVMCKLAEHVTPLALGSVNRQYSHIRLVARKLLTARNLRVEENKIAGIIEALTEKMYSHGHAIGRKEAEELGLPVVRPDATLESAMWELYAEYEDALQLNATLDGDDILSQHENEEDVSVGTLPLAVIESSLRSDIFEATAILRRRRQVPVNPQINVNLNVGLPPTVDMGALPQQVQQVLQQMINQLGVTIQQMVQREIVRQSPMVGYEWKAFGGKWKTQVRTEEHTDANQS